MAGLIAAGRAFARFECGQVVFKAEVGSQSPSVGQIQGVWVHPEWRATGSARRGRRRWRPRWSGWRIASLYVNGYNAIARAAYSRVGFTEVGRSPLCCWTDRAGVAVSLPHFEMSQS